MKKGLVTVLLLCRGAAGLHQAGCKLLFVRQVPSSITLCGKSHLLEGVVTLKPISSDHWLKAPPPPPPPPPTNRSSLPPFLSALTPLHCSRLRSNQSFKLSRFSINFRSSTFQYRLPVFKTHTAGRRAGRMHTGQARVFSAHVQVLPLWSLFCSNPYFQS